MSTERADSPNDHGPGTQEKPDVRLYQELPVGVSLQDLLRALPNTDTLFAEFLPVIAEPGMENQQGSWSIDLGEETLTLYAAKYHVNRGGEGQGVVFMNPIDHDGTLPDSVDLPLIVDEFLATDDARTRLKVRGYSPDGNLDAAIQTVQELKSNDDYTEKQTSFSERFFNATDVQTMTSQAEAAHGLNGVQHGFRAQEMLPQMVWWTAFQRYLDQKPQSDEQSIIDTTERLAREEILLAVEQLSEIVERRPQQLQNLDLDENALAWGFDHVKASDHDTEALIVTTYIPKRGWTVGWPQGACAAAAAGAFENHLQGTMPENELQRFRATLIDETEAGHLLIDKQERTIIFTDMQRLDITQAFFHGDDTVIHGLETLRIFGDVVMGEKEFQMILYKDDTEFEENLELVEPIRIVFPPALEEK